MKYLGDGVYAEVDEASRLVLTTSDGITETNRIVLESDVFAILLAYVHLIPVAVKGPEKK